MSDWAVRLTSENCGYAAQLRDCGEVQVLQLEDGLWLRGAVADDLGDRVASLPGERFDVLEDGQLRVVGNRVPSARLPDGEWRPIREFFDVILPTAQYATARHDRVPLRLERDPSSKSEADAMLIDRRVWLDYIDTAPQIRLTQLRFAAAEDGHVLVLGTPLPPLPGLRLTGASEGLITPAGLSWVPKVDAVVARQVFGGDANALVLWLESDHWQFVAADCVLAASRSAVRATLAASETNR